MAYYPRYKPKMPKPVTEVIFDLTADEVVMHLHRLMHLFERSYHYKVANILVEKIRVQKIKYAAITKYSITVTYWITTITKPLLLDALKNLPSPPIKSREGL